MSWRSNGVILLAGCQLPNVQPFSFIRAWTGWEKDKALGTSQAELDWTLQGKICVCVLCVWLSACETSYFIWLDLGALEWGNSLRGCSEANPAVHFDDDGSNLIQTPNDPSRSLFGLKFERSLPRWTAGWAHYKSCSEPLTTGPCSQVYSLPFDIWLDLVPLSVMVYLCLSCTCIDQTIDGCVGWALRTRSN